MLPGLCREEESTIKTALALAIVKARRNKKRRIEEENVNKREQNLTEGKKIDNGDEMEQSSSFHTLDQLFQSHSTDENASLSISFSSNEKVFLQCGCDERLLNGTFQAAQNVAKMDLLKRANDKKAVWKRTHSLRAVVAHLARQLQVFLAQSTGCKDTSEEYAIAAVENIDSTGATDTQDTSSCTSLVGGNAALQKWIHSTLLQNIQKNTSLSEGIVLEVVAAFRVYEIMIPEISDMSPVIVGHIFQVTTKLIRDLYDDKIVLKKPPDAKNDQYKNVLDYLTCSALRLLGTCWTSKVASPAGRGKKHKAFLLSELQNRLGDLMIPLTFSEAPKVYHRLLSKQKIRTHEVHTSLAAFTKIKKQKDITRGKRSILVAPKEDWKIKAQQPGLDYYFLDPSAKLVVQIAVYRLLMK